VLAYYSLIFFCTLPLVKTKAIQRFLVFIYQFTDSFVFVQPVGVNDFSAMHKNFGFHDKSGVERGQHRG